ncbi:hypothetical protein HLH34_17640 [Gluconacetobacter azotocaptans]|uniref:Uncharacterized protein n=1 Tax=Gluconacetobacter azotocaptans TaxID=142834 RepID=A0A7W4PGN1_9PROT|nr:hypothetical protein [Gluconacetobacter azotocaptans]MBB2191759.1 hypothetical protein [Gluconacetobacter azotocaptans]MBM9400975.1 hypothetical protein [Gluconacetobacter azotocaptans]GBQ34139.1 hypothetical protein AA13594_2811 [Gluconacetobacter azotocaptans DSM 13594]
MHPDAVSRPGPIALLALAGGLLLGGCQASPPAMTHLSPAAQAYLTVDTYFIAEGIVSGRLSSGHILHDQARDMLTSTLHARYVTAQNVLHPSADGQRRARQAIETMLACVGQADGGTNVPCLPPGDVSARDAARRAAAAVPPEAAAAAPR